MSTDSAAQLHGGANRTGRDFGRRRGNCAGNDVQWHAHHDTSVWLALRPLRGALGNEARLTGLRGLLADIRPTLFRSIGLYFLRSGRRVLLKIDGF